MNNWISVNDLLPKLEFENYSSRMVLIVVLDYDGTSFVDIGYRSKIYSSDIDTVWLDEHGAIVTVTHWQPLPEF